MKKAFVALTIVALPAALIARWGNRQYLYNDSFSAPFSWSGGGFFMLIITFLLAGLLAYFIIKNKGFRSSDNSALETLKLRYAKGEITKKEFDDVKADLA